MLHIIYKENFVLYCMPLFWEDEKCCYCLDDIMWAGYVVVILDKAWVILLYWWFIEAWLNLQIADVAQAIVNAIHEDESIGQTFELVG